ncbi:MAG: GNAT family N-acetyltransferase [Clostridia bacterium]|nr:GNAT family N-acetyltransferase [Clostridia bacterium]
MNAKEQCKKIYLEAFDDGDDSFTKMLFENCFEYCRYSVSGDTVTAMLFALPCELVCPTHSINTIYLYAVATLKDYRGQGIMSELIEKIKKQSQNTLLLLRPIDNSVISFYKRLGFKETAVDNRTSGLPFVKPLGGYRELAKAVGCDGESFTAMYFSQTERIPSKISFKDSMP